MTKYNNYQAIAHQMKMFEVIEIFDRLNKADGHETEQELETIRNMIDQTNMPDAIRNVLVSKHRVLNKRLNTSVPPYFGPRVKESRKKLGLSINQASRKTNGQVCVSFWSRIESGKRKCTTDTIKAIADVVQVPMTELLGMATDNEKQKEPIPLNHLILENRVTVDNKELSIKQKELITQLLNKLHQFSWTSETKHLDSLEIAHVIEQYKQSFEMEVATV